VYGTVRALTVYNGNLIAAGEFTTAGGGSASHIASWDGAGWHTLGLGLSGTNPSALALIVYNGDLIAGGGFEFSDGGFTARIAKWNGLSWSALGSGIDGGYPRGYPYVDALSIYGGRLIAAGFFESSGGVPAVNIARWDGSTWQGLGDGVDAQANALAVYNNDLLVGGRFITAGGSVSAYWARWFQPTADFNGDNAINSQDFFDFLGAFFALAPAADFNRDGAVNSQDFFDFLGAFFAGC
jgi:hypothetical protein